MPNDLDNIYQQLNFFDDQHNKRLSSYEAQVTKILDQARNEAARIATTIKPNAAKVFSFSDHPQTKARIDKLTTNLFQDLATTINSNVRAEWDASDLKNDDLLRGMNKGEAPTPEMISRYGRKNIAARAAFQNRIVGGLTISDRVWNLTGQFKSEVEAAIDYSITQGVAANKIAPEIQRYLKNPDKLFRRVRGADGKLRLSRPAQAFHPGQGVYRSSYKNARRLAATEPNIAYRTADYERWNDMDFILGIEVKLSNNHTLNGVPFVDICDTLAGRYPKDYKFTGWHPLCRCRAVPILASQDEFIQAQRDLIEGREPQPYTGAVTQIPERHTVWIANNADRINRSRSVPYFMTDNAKLISRASNQTTATANQAAQAAKKKIQDVADVRIKEQAEAAMKPSTKKEFFVEVNEETIRQHNEYWRNKWWSNMTMEEAKKDLMQANLARSRGYDVIKRATGRFNQTELDTLMELIKDPRTLELQLTWRVNTIDKALTKQLKVPKVATPKIPSPIKDSTTPFTLDKAAMENLRKKGYTFNASVSLNEIDNFAIEAYNKNLKGFNLEKLDKEMTDIFSKVNVRFRSKQVIFKDDYIQMKWISDKAEIYRRFDFKKGSVEHEYFRLDGGLQGGGISKKVFKSMYEQYQNAGVKQITVHANIDVGGYTWAKYGFTAEPHAFMANIRNHGLRSESTKAIDIVEKWIKKHPGKDDFPVLQIANTTWGKDFLLHSNWWGKIDLTNAAKRKIFEDYINSVKPK